MATECISTIKNCPKCSGQFICHSVGCWCSELPQIMPLSQQAECYCPQCLIDIIVEKMELTSE